jgi:hypothetical protein
MLILKYVVVPVIKVPNCYQNYKYRAENKSDHLPLSLRPMIVATAHSRAQDNEVITNVIKPA